MTVLWDYGTQDSAPGSGPPGAWSGDPGDTVGYLWEEPAELSNGNIKIRALLGCSDEINWAGAVVYGSIDGTTYQRIGLTKQRSILGVTTTLLAAGASDWQPTGTVTVNLSASPGALNSVNATAAFFGANMCLIGDELCTFVTATLLAPNVYQLTGVLRAWYDTERVAHAIGSRFALITVSQDKFELTKDELLTETLWKATSLNLSGHEQTLADAHAYSLYIYGRGLHTEYQNGRTRQFIAGEALSEGDHVYLKVGDGKVWKAVSTSTPKLGLVQSPKTPVVADEKVYVQVDGLMKCAVEPTPVGVTWAWTAGSYLYGTAVAGTLSHTNDGYGPVALALTATEILIFAPRKPDGIIQTLNAIGWAPKGDGIHAGYVGGNASLVGYKYNTPTGYISIAFDALSYLWYVSGTQRMTLIGNVLAIDHVAEYNLGHNIVFDSAVQLAGNAGFWGHAPVAQPAAVADATDAASVILRLNDLLSRMRGTGFIAP